MSTATVTAEADAPAAPKGGKKKLIIIIVAAVVLLAALGVGALLFLKKGQAEDEEDGDAHAEAAAEVVVPTFVPLDPFTVNLADKEAERYAQIGVTLAIEDPAVGDSIKAFMPAIRNNILMVLAHKTSAELLERDGKDQLAREIMAEASRAMGYRVDGQAGDDAPRKKGKKGKKPSAPPLPIKAVYFSNFIVQ